MNKGRLEAVTPLKPTLEMPRQQSKARKNQTVMTSVNKSRFSKLNSPRDEDDPYKSAETFKLTEARTTKKSPPPSSLRVNKPNLTKIGSVQYLSNLNASTQPTTMNIKDTEAEDSLFSKGLTSEPKMFNKRHKSLQPNVPDLKFRY